MPGREVVAPDPCWMKALQQPWRAVGLLFKRTVPLWASALPAPSPCLLLSAVQQIVCCQGMYRGFNGKAPRETPWVTVSSWEKWLEQQVVFLVMTLISPQSSSVAPFPRLTDRFGGWMMHMSSAQSHTRLNGDRNGQSGAECFHHRVLPVVAALRRSLPRSCSNL